jgi:hypothetical protein
MKLVQVKDTRGLARDVTTNAIVNTDQAAYANYMRTKALAVKKQETFEQHGRDIDFLKGEIGEIKSLLLQLVSQGKT